MKVGAVIASALFAVAVLACTIWLGRYGGSLPAEESEPVEKAEKPTISQTGPHPQVVVDEPEHNFGRMAVGTEGSHAFVIRNEGEGPLTLHLESVSCKCTLSKFEEESIPPGESTEVELAWTPRSPSPTFREMAVISTNDPENPEITLVVTGETFPVLMTYPEDVWSLGTIEEGKPTTVSGLFLSPLHDEFKILEINSSHELLSAEAAPADAQSLESAPVPINANSAYEVTVTLQPGVDVGPFRESISVRTDIPEVEEFTLYIEGTRKGPVHFLPTGNVKWYSNSKVLDLGKFPASQGKTARLSMFLTELPSEEVEILGVQSESKLVKVDFEPDRNFQAAGRKRYRLTVEVPPGGPPASRVRESSVKVNITTSHPDAPELTLCVQFISL